MNKNKKQKRTIPRHLLLILIGLILIAACVGFIVFRQSSHNKTATIPQKTIESQIGQSDTTKTGNASDKGKADQGSSNPVVTTPGQNVTPFISYFGVSGSNLEVDAYIPVIDEGGTCTLQVKNGTGAVVFNSTTAAHADAQSTRCENFVFANSGADSSWTATVSFQSPQYSGSSTAVKFN